MRPWLFTPRRRSFTQYSPGFACKKVPGASTRKCRPLTKLVLMAKFEKTAEKTPTRKPPTSEMRNAAMRSNNKARKPIGPPAKEPIRRKGKERTNPSKDWRPDWVALSFPQFIAPNRRTLSQASGKAIPLRKDCGKCI